MFWVLLFIIFSLVSCRPVIPTDPPDTGLPAVALTVPLVVDGQKLVPSWINFGDVDGDWDNDIICSWYGDTLGHEVSGWRKMVAVFRNNGPGSTASLLWYDWWTEPQQYLSYENFSEQGPIVVGNIKGGDHERCEIAFRYYDSESASYYLKTVNGFTGKIIQVKQLDFSAEWSHGPQDLLAGNFMQARGSILSDLIVVYRHYGKTARRIECRNSRTLAVNWTYTLEHDGRYNDKWAAHRVEILPHPNGRDCLWYGDGILDWHGRGRLDGGPAFGNSQIEFQPYPGGEGFPNVQHWDSFCYLNFNTLYATTDSRRAWRLKGPSEWVKPRNEQKYWEYIPDMEVGSNNDEWDRTTTHTHRFRVLRTGNDPRLLCSDVYSGGDYTAIIFDRDFNIHARFPSAKEIEAERIEWDGDHTSYEVLTSHAVYNVTGEKVADRVGPKPNKSETNFTCDLFGIGHEQIGYFYQKDGRWFLAFQANPDARKAEAVPVEINASFY